MINNIGYTNQYVPAFGNVNSGFQKGLQGAAVANQNVIKNLAGYTFGNDSICPEETLGSALSGTPLFLSIFGGIQAFPWLKKNFKHPFSTIKAEKDAFLANPSNKRYDFAGNAKKVLVEQKDKLFHKMTDAEKAALQKDRKFLGKTLDLIPGYKKLRATGFGQLMGKSGAGWMIAIDGTIRLFTEIVPTFKTLGTGAGLQQTGKTVASVAAGAAGWTAGEVAGSAAGAAIGTAICPGIGTAVGKFVGGFIGGTIGMYFAGKAAKAVVGKSELEKASGTQAENIAKQCENSPEMQISLAANAAQKAAEVLKHDPNNAEAQAVLAQAEEILNAAQSQIETQNTAKTESENTAAQNTAKTESENTAAQNIGQFGSMTAANGLNIPTVPGFNGAGYDMNQYSQALSKASMPQQTKTTTAA